MSAASAKKQNHKEMTTNQEGQEIVALLQVSEIQHHFSMASRNYSDALSVADEVYELIKMNNPEKSFYSASLFLSYCSQFLERILSITSSSTKVFSAFLAVAKTSTHKKTLVALVQQEHQQLIAHIGENISKNLLARKILTNSIDRLQVNKNNKDEIKFTVSQLIKPLESTYLDALKIVQNIENFMINSLHLHLTQPLVEYAFLMAAEASDLVAQAIENAKQEAKKGVNADGGSHHLMIIYALEQAILASCIRQNYASKVLKDNTENARSILINLQVVISREFETFLSSNAQKSQITAWEPKISDKVHQVIDSILDAISKP